VLLVNNDVLVGDHALDRLAETVARQPEAGVVGWATEIELNVDVDAVVVVVAERPQATSN